MSDHDRAAMQVLFSAELPVGLCLLDAQGQPQRANAAARRLLGRSAETPVEIGA